jgi:hypothetical protein
MISLVMIVKDEGFPGGGGGAGVAGGFGGHGCVVVTTYF